MQPTPVMAPKLPWRKRTAMALKRYWIVYLMALPVVAYYIIFHYLPMFGIVISFQNFRVTRGFFGSK